MPAETPDVHVLPDCEGVSIHFGDIKEFTETSITFDGYLRAEPELLPVRRIFIVGSEWLLVSIESMETLEDTSKGFYDEEEGGYIVLTPTALLKITYKVLQVLEGADTVKAVHDELVKELETERERNWKLRSARERREMEAAAGISYADLLRTLIPCPNQDTCSQSGRPVDCSGQYI